MHIFAITFCLNLFISALLLYREAQRTALFFLGALAGFSLGLLINNAVLYRAHNDFVLWASSLMISIIFGSITDGRNEYRLIHMSSLAGSFLTVYGIGMLSGRYTNPFLVTQLINKGIIDSVDHMFVMYLLGHFVMYGIGCLTQHAQLRKIIKSDQTDVQISSVPIFKGTTLNESLTED